MFSAEDIRQYYYCKRIIYYRYVLRARVRETYKMRKGREIHEKAMIKNADGDVKYGVYLISEDLGLVAVIDALIVKDGFADIIEFKFGDLDRRMRDSHKAQLAAQAILVESLLGLRVRKIIIYNPEKEEKREVRLVNYHREMVREALKDMKRIVIEEDLPEPTEDRGKCIDCEYRVFCGDIPLD